ncbi:hypothetical protein [Lacipirellula parvula]|uniref:Uncharacterized protein n=1 Tax=Lacipirellula parvula TaxID=2650471 RepID=A0A5K7XHL7_9BACT|nr:hypothetical protein [Lacipirellula parvula]BBO35542.1 hypothetical protein PLANPX_5154 [Lacipirellula parvula]
MILTYQSVDQLWTVCHSEQIFCHRATKPQALAAVVAAFPELPLADIEAAFENPADPQTFRATLQAATQSTLAAVEDATEQLSESAELARIKALVTLTHAAVSDMTAAIERENDTRAAETKVNAERLAAFKAEQAKQAAAAEQKRLAVIAQQQRKAAEADKARDLKAGRLRDGTVEVTENHFTTIDGNVRKVRRVVARYAAGETLPPGVEAML